MFQSYLERSALWERQEKIIISRRYILSEKEKKKYFGCNTLAVRETGRNL